MYKQFGHPEVVPILRGNQLVSDTTKFEENKVCVVSVIGSTPPSQFGLKRAFRLAVDAFGASPSFFEDKEEESNPQPKEASDGEEEARVNEEEAIKEDDDQGQWVAETETESNGIYKEEREVPMADEGEGEEATLVSSLAGGIDDESIMKHCFLDGFYSESGSILFLHVTGGDDPMQLLSAVEQLQDKVEESGFLPIWTSLKSVYCRCLLMVFSLSHIVLFSGVGSSFDTSYLHLFRILDSVRLTVKSALSRALENVKVLNQDWISYGRICCPRLLFLFEVDIPYMEKTLAQEDSRSFLYGALEEKKTELEDEIYHIFRKCRIITNISAKSLFALPSEDDFVFLFDRTAQNVKYTDVSLTQMYLEIISETCAGTRTNSKLSVKDTTPPCLNISVKQVFGSEPCGSAATYSDVLDKFKRFVCHHAKLAHKGGFDDNRHKATEHKHFFVVPTLGEWKLGFQVTYETLFGSDIKSGTLQEGFDQLIRYLNVDSEYLYNQCAAVFPKIYALYQRGLPEFYLERTHKLRLAHAMNAYLTISRGAGVLPWLNKLAEKCEQYWRRGRQQCEVISLFGHHCTNPLHSIAAEDNLEILPPPKLNHGLLEMKHNAGAKIVSHCNCGRRQGYRDEPFTIREANFGFYQRIGKDCCENLDHYEFPVFVLSASGEDISVVDMLNILQARRRTGFNSGEDEQINQSLMMEADLRQEHIDLGDYTPEGSQNSMDEVLEEIMAVVIRNEGSSPVDHEKQDFTETQNTEPEAMLAETNMTEYLPGMVHSKAPNLLPKFSSWSLVRLGLSSLYNHASGISPRAGFLAGASYLLPWDVIVKAEAGVSKPVPRMIRGRRTSNKPKPISDKFNVKVFFGLEYECPRGHRFIANDLEKLIDFDLGNSGLRDVAPKIANFDMPLFFKCPCKESRDGRTMVAQLIRIHVVTPKAPVHCMIAPRIHPAFSSLCPVFFPEMQDPIKLKTSSYWVMRLPYCYVGDQVYGPPQDPSNLQRSHAKIYGGFLTVQAMNASETKTWEKENL